MIETCLNEQTVLRGTPTRRELRGLGVADLVPLATRIRHRLVESVCAAGGHLGSNLGVVELTIALHRVFDSPHDTILFDVGHQAYAHKILTGRSDEFAGLRQAGGISGYPSRAESVHDVIENSHASVALAWADGLGKSRQLTEPDRAVVAVIGDGALTGGVALEGLTNLAEGGAPVVIVLNDNARSYAPTGGGLGRHLTTLRGRVCREVVAGAVGPGSNVFTDLGLDYFGPVDGHDVLAVERALRSARERGRPTVVHCVTRKGMGFRPATDDDEDHLHAVGVVDPRTGRPASDPAPTWTDVFSDELCHLGELREDIVAITAAMPGPTGLARFGAKFPDRVFDVGIAEQHAVACAAGHAFAGHHPVVAVYATFLNRAYDQLLMDVALHRAPVTLVLDRAGITGPDGPSHHGMWDLPLLAMTPNLRVAAPRDPARLRALLSEAVAVSDGPTVLRFPKMSVDSDLDAVRSYAGLDLITEPAGPADVLLVSVGPLAQPCLAAARELAVEGIFVTVVDPRWVLPVNSALIDLARSHDLVVTVEDGSRVGGVGAAVAQECQDAGVRARVLTLGLPRAFQPHASRANLLSAHGLDARGIAAAIRAARKPALV
jgi:1-deoxy-D-xylulose-5-phosphate synthase